MPTEQMQSDVLIIGAGIVGLTFALALSQSTPLSIAIVDRALPLAMPLTIDHDLKKHHRVSAISLASERIFKRLGVWDAIVDQGDSTFSEMAVWDQAGQTLHFSSQSIASSHLGHMIENEVIQAALLQKLQSYPQVKQYNPIQLLSYHEEKEQIILETNIGIFSTRLAVASDGGQSWLRDKAGITCHKKKYNEEALVATLLLKESHDHIAKQGFLSTGAIASLPLKDAHLTSLVWYLPNALMTKIRSLSKDDFCREVTAAFSHHIGEVIDASPHQVFSLVKQNATQYVKAHLALLGDAAHTVHPLAGQGVNMGLLDAASLVDVIQEALFNRRDFASLTTLRKYERWRMADHAPWLFGIDWIKYLFEHSWPGLTYVRAFGLKMLNQFPALQIPFIHYAVGHRSDLPILAKIE